MGSTVDTVVSSCLPAFPTSSPNWALAMPAMPIDGGGDPGEAQIDLGFLERRPLAACTPAREEASRPMASSRSFLLTALAAARGLILSKVGLGGVELAFG